MKTNLGDVYGFLRESNEELENLNSGAGGYDTFVIIAPVETGGKNILKKLL